MYIYTYTQTHGILVIKNKLIFPFTTTQINLECFMLSEISQTERDKYCTRYFHYMWNLINKTETDS